MVKTNDKFKRNIEMPDKYAFMIFATGERILFDFFFVALTSKLRIKSSIIPMSDVVTNKRFLPIPFEFRHL